MIDSSAKEIAVALSKNKLPSYSAERPAGSVHSRPVGNEGRVTFMFSCVVISAIKFGSDMTCDRRVSAVAASIAA